MATYGPSIVRDRLKLIVPSLLTIIAFVASLFFFFIPRVEDITIEQEREAIRELVSLPLQICSSLAARAEAGEIGQEEARSRAAELIRDMRYGVENKDYFWILDTRPVLLMHPYRSDLEGTDVSDYRDRNGTAVFMEMKEVAEEEGAGYVAYNWQLRDEAKEIGQKLSYVSFFEEWDWIIGTGIYLGEVEAEIAGITRSMIWVSLAVTLGISLMLLSLIRQGFVLQEKKNAAAAELFKSKLQYQQLIELMHEGFAMQDTEGRFSFVNRRFCTMLGYREEEILHKRVADFISDEYRPTFEENMERRKEGGEEGGEAPYRVEWKTKGGERLVTLVSPRLYYDAEGTHTGSFAVFTDITDMQRAEEKLTALLQEKTVLLKEVHHRVKNNLQLISSLFSLQYLNTSDEITGSILQDSQMRIQTITRVHEFLYQSESLKDIDIREFLEQLILDISAAFDTATSGEIRFVTEVEALILPLDKAIPCGLIMNELVSNAVKHAFPPGLPLEQDKRVVLFLQKENGSICFGVEDNGRGFPDDFRSRPSRNLGMELVTILTEQLNGEISFQQPVSHGGSKVEIRISL